MSTHSAHAVHVSNISPKTTEASLREFFAFCGEVKTVEMTKASDGTQQAIVSFGDANTAQTALLLSSAYVDEYTLTVKKFEAPSNTAASSQPGEAAATGAAPAPSAGNDKLRAATAVMASMLAAGYTFGEGAFQKAVAWDRDHGVTDSIIKRATDINDRYKVSEKVTEAAGKGMAKAKEIDQAYGISEKATTALDTGIAAGSVLASRAMTNETVRSGVGFLGKAFNAVKATASELSAETRQQVEERRAARAAASGAAAAGSPTAAEEAATPSAPPQETAEAPSTTA